jgi:hypothetical protein
MLLARQPLMLLSRQPLREPQFPTKQSTRTAHIKAQSK